MGPTFGRSANSRIKQTSPGSLSRPLGYKFEWATLENARNVAATLGATLATTNNVAPVAASITCQRKGV